MSNVNWAKAEDWLVKLVFLLVVTAIIWCLFRLAVVYVIAVVLINFAAKWFLRDNSEEEFTDENAHD